MKVINAEKLPKNSLRFKNEEKFNNIKEVIEKALTVDHTVNSLPKTYYAKNKNQQYDGRWIGRSLQDLYNLCLYYFPETKVEDVILILKQISPTSPYCCTTRKTMFRNYAGQSFNDCNLLKDVTNIKCVDEKRKSFNLIIEQ